MLIDLHSGAVPIRAVPPGADCCQGGQWPCWIDDSYSPMKLYSSFLSRAALARWTMTINPLSGTHLFLLLLRVLTSRSLPQSQPVSATETKTEMEGRKTLRSCDCLARCSHSLISNHSAISNTRLTVQMSATPLARIERRTL